MLSDTPADCCGAHEKSQVVLKDQLKKIDSDREREENEKIGYGLFMGK